MSNPHPLPQPLGRGTLTFSPERFNTSVKFLESAIANERNPTAVRINCVSILMTIYGLQVPQPRRIKEQVKDLVMAHSFQTQMAAQVDAQIEAERIQEAAQAEAVAQEITRQVYSTILD